MSADHVTLIHPPQQRRSQETLARIKAAAEELMEEIPFEKITVQKIVKKAKTTTGSFYARFEDKDALLEALHTEHVTENVALMERYLAELPDSALADRVAIIVRMIAASFYTRPALMRSGTLAYWNNPETEHFGRIVTETHNKFGQQIRRIGQELATVAKGFGHPHPKDAGMFALKVALAASRQHYLFSDERTILKVSDRKFEKQMTAMVLAYLQHGE